MATGGRNVKKDAEVGVGANKSSIVEQAKVDFKANRPLMLETLISTDRFINISIPTPLAKALGITTETELETQINALGVSDEIKQFVPHKKNAQRKDEGRASTGDVESIPLGSDIIGTAYRILLHTPILYGPSTAQKKRRWYTVRVPQVMGIASFSLFLARFATATKMPRGFTTLKSSRLYVPKNSTVGLTKVDKPA